MSDEIPKRRHELSLKISADSMEDLDDAFEEIRRQLHEAGNQSVGGSPSWGHVLEHVVRPAQTPEVFRAELTTWLASVRPAAGEG